MKKISMDYSRFIAALLVVAIHTYPFLDWNVYLEVLFTHVFCRIAVPFFLMITGYYLIPKAIRDRNVLINYTKKILKIYFIAILLYVPINIYVGTFSHFTLLDGIQLLFIDGTFYHLWYFPALILGIWLSYYFIQHFSNRWVIIVVSVLYLIGLLGDSYYGIIRNWDVAHKIYDVIFRISTYTRNGLFYAPIFICMGYYIGKLKGKRTIKKNLFWFLFFLFAMEIEGIILYVAKLPRHDSMYIFLIPVMFFLFQVVLEGRGKVNKKIRNIAAVIYVIHPLMIIVVRGMAKVLHMEKIFIDHHFLHYWGVVFLSILFSVGFINGKRRVKNAIITRKKYCVKENESVDRN